MFKLLLLPNFAKNMRWYLLCFKLYQLTVSTQSHQTINLNKLNSLAHTLYYTI